MEKLLRKFIIQTRASVRFCSSKKAEFSTAAQEKELTKSTSPSVIYTPDHIQLQETLSKVIENDINPHVDTWESEQNIPLHKVFKILGNAGYLGINRPTEYGGLGLDYTYNVASAEMLGSITCGSVPMAIGVQTDMATPALARFGSDKLKKEFLAPAISGDMVAAIGVSEAGGGSDVANIKTTAKQDGDDLVINGSKMWITNAFHADFMVLLANTSEDLSHRNKSLIVVPMKTPGIHLAKRISKIGMWSSDTAQIFLEDVRVPKSHVIGQEGQGFTYQMLQFQEERIYGAAVVLKALENVINETIEYTKDRAIFGKSVLDNQVVHYRLAELQSEVEMLRSAVYRTVVEYVQGKDVTMMASMCKLKAGRLCREVSDSCLQYWGGMGFTSENIVSRAYRDLRLMSIGGGTDETMLSIICKLMNTLPSAKKLK